MSEDSKITHGLYVDTTANWNAQPFYIPLEGDLIVYSDRGVTEDSDGNITYVSGTKIGDGIHYLGELDFISDIPLNTETDIGTTITIPSTDGGTTEITVPNLADYAFSVNVNDLIQDDDSIVLIYGGTASDIITKNIQNPSSNSGGWNTSGGDGESENNPQTVYTTAFGVSPEEFGAVGDGEVANFDQDMIDQRIRSLRLDTDGSNIILYLGDEVIAEVAIADLLRA